jgi:hypothetical protein
MKQSSRSGSSLILCLLVAAAALYSPPSRPAAKSAQQQQQVISTPFCPKGSRGYFVLYYGTDAAEFNEIRGLQPDFVIGDVPAKAQAKGQLAEFYRQMHDPASPYPPVRAILYKSTGRKVGKEIKGSLADPAAVDAYVRKALGAGYEGIFFDDIDPSRHDYNYARAKTVKDFGKDRLVIMNPGRVVGDARIFDYADIVSVENQWFMPLPALPGVAPHRWLAVQGDPGDQQKVFNYLPPTTLGEAVKRLNEFRSGAHAGGQGAGGFWYYSAGDKLWKLPPYGSKQFRDEVLGLQGSGNACP